MRTSVAYACASKLGVTPKRLPTPIIATGYNGIEGNSITHYILFNLIIDGRHLYGLPFLILDLGNHDIILGSKWMRHFDVQVDIKRQQLHWPDSLPPTEIFSRSLRIPLTRLLHQEANQTQQQDARRRDRHFEKDLQRDERQKIAGRSRIAHIDAMPTISTQIDMAHSAPNRKFYQTSEVATTNLPQTVESTDIIDLGYSTRYSPKARKIQPLLNRFNKVGSLKLDICEISAPAFHLNLRQRENTVFQVSLYELDRELEERRLPEEVSEEDTADDLEELRQRLPHLYTGWEDCFSKAASDKLPPHRSYDHKIEIESGASLGHGPLYSQSTAELQAVKDYLLENLDKGFIEPSQAPFSSPVLFVKKANGSLRFCIDFRKLNQITRKDRYPLPLIDETLARLNKAKIYTKLDIRQAFHRIRMHPEHEELTTFRTRYGNYKCKVLPFGLTNGPATYQRYMNDILFDLLDVTCTAYLDDILIYSENEAEHHLHVKAVLERLRLAGLQADIRKCEFSVKRTKYLGFIITTNGLEVDPDKVAVVKDWRYPKTVKGVQSFLGFCNFYRRFIPNYGNVAKPLTKLTHIGAIFDFNEDCRNSFGKLQDCLVNAPILAHYDPKRESRLETDASDGVVAAIFSQKGDDDHWHPVAYFSKTMAPAELNYEIHDKEMLSIIRSLSHWRAELMSAPERIQILTDHKALEYFMYDKKLTARQARWGEILSQFFIQIAYRSGKTNDKADALTRREQDVEPQDALKEKIRFRSLLKPEQLHQKVKYDLNICFMEPFPLIESVIKHNKAHPSLNALREKATDDKEEDYAIEDGLLLYQGRLIVPDVENLQTQLIREAHAQAPSAHCGSKKSRILLQQRYYWKGLRPMVNRYVANCHECRRAHVPRDKTPGLHHPLPIPDHPWQHICIDFKSQSMDVDGFDNICVFIDRFGKNPVSIPCHKTATAEDMAWLYYVHVYRHYDLPDSIVSDRGPQFISQFWNALMSILGVKVTLSTAYSPQTDGQTEIMNQYSDQRLRPFVNHYQDNWSKMLPALDNAALTLPHESIGTSPFFLTRGYSPRKSFDWKAPKKPETAQEKLSHEKAIAFAKMLQDGWEVGKKIMAAAQEKQSRDVNKSRRIPDFDVGDYVWLLTKHLKLDRPNRKLAEQATGPFEILQKVGYSYKLKLREGMRIHPVQHARFLRLDPNNPLPGQRNEPPPAINVTGDDEYPVETMRAVKKVGKTLKYRANWLNTDEDPVYYPASDFKYSPHALRDFHLANPTLPGPPALLPEWLKLFENGVDNYDELKGNEEMKKSLKSNFYRQFSKDD